MSDSNVTRHSRSLLGTAEMIPIVPAMPIGAQVHGRTRIVQLRLTAESYVRTSLQTILPDTMATIWAQPLEPSYSGGRSQYHRLGVTPDGYGDAILKAGNVIVGRVGVHPFAQIISVDWNSEIEPGSEGPPSRFKLLDLLDR
jgi:hypothetical protein